MSIASHVNSIDLKKAMEKKQYVLMKGTVVKQQEVAKIGSARLRLINAASVG